LYSAASRICRVIETVWCVTDGAGIQPRPHSKLAHTDLTCSHTAML